MSVSLSAVAAKAGAVLVVLASMFVSYTTVSAWRGGEADRGAQVFGPDLTSIASSDEAPANPFADVHGTHLVAYVFTASDCGWSAMPESMEAIGNVRDELRTAHGDSYANITVVGVALDHDVQAGVDFLAKISDGAMDSAFDQISVGESWLNEHVVRFAWRDSSAQAMTPSVVLVERPISTDDYLETSRIDVEEDKFLMSVGGRVAMRTWINSGVPITSRSDNASVTGMR